MYLFIAYAINITNSNSIPLAEFRYTIMTEIIISALLGEQMTTTGKWRIRPKL